MVDHPDIVPPDEPRPRQQQKRQRQLERKRFHALAARVLRVQIRVKRVAQLTGKALNGAHAGKHGQRTGKIGPYRPEVEKEKHRDHGKQQVIELQAKDRVGPCPGQRKRNQQRQTPRGGPARRTLQLMIHRQIAGRRRWEQDQIGEQAGQPFFHVGSLRFCSFRWRSRMVSK